MTRTTTVTAACLLLVLNLGKQEPVLDVKQEEPEPETSLSIITSNIQQKLAAQVRVVENLGPLDRSDPDPLWDTKFEALRILRELSLEAGMETWDEARINQELALIRGSNRFANLS